MKFLKFYKFAFAFYVMLITAFSSNASECLHSWSDCTPYCEGTVTTTHHRIIGHITSTYVPVTFYSEKRCSGCSYSASSENRGSLIYADAMDSNRTEVHKSTCGQKLCNGFYRRCDWCSALQHSAVEKGFLHYVGHSCLAVSILSIGAGAVAMGVGGPFAGLACLGVGLVSVTGAMAAYHADGKRRKGTYTRVSRIFEDGKYAR